jgi:hypothetical protein
MTAEQFEQSLSSESLVRLSAVEWAELDQKFERVACHRTFVAGDLLIMRSNFGLFAVEQPEPDTRVARFLTDAAEVDRFIAERMDQYERMWDGCGCKIDYYSKEW